MLTAAILKALKDSSYPNELSTIMDYAVFPAGKLFRPRLVMSLASDLGLAGPELTHLACALEIHHAYTLVHDDLPAMDNDLMRRGKAATHAQYGEWKAILTGDALLISSFHEAQKTKNFAVQKLFTWATGAKGLILGQFLDLNTQGTLTVKDIIRIHELKTSRLIQVATLGTYLLSTTNLSRKDVLKYFRLGRNIGVAFQLLDDLADLAVLQINQHEKNINPYLIHPEMAFQELKLAHSRLKAFLSQRDQYPQLSSMLEQYFKDSQELLLKDLPFIEKHLGPRFSPQELRTWLEKTIT